jgi:hypothetical protein
MGVWVYRRRRAPPGKFDCGPNFATLCGVAISMNGLAVAVFLVVGVALPACRVGPFVTSDAAREPLPDAGTDVDGNPDVAGGGPPCDLLLQNCTDPKAACYPVDGQPGATMCTLPPGTAPPMTGCVSNVECDKREVCVFVTDALLYMCATICNPSAAVTGCLPKAACLKLTGFSAGYCVP